MQQIGATIPVASIAMARLRLEDVFLRLVAADTAGTEAERALRANLQGVKERWHEQDLLIAQRDFLTTVSNKGFLFGLFILPLMIGLALLVGPRLLSAARSPQVVGRVVVMDPTGQVLPELRSTLSTSAIKTRTRRTRGEHSLM
jgi:hypothetical protein